MSKQPQPMEQLLMSHVEFVDGHWLWTARTTRGGYGLTSIRVSAGVRRTTYAHRVSYELFVGPIPHGLEIDHLCHNIDSTCQGGPDCLHRRCINPTHLEPATRRENLVRGHTAIALNVVKTHCIRGHPFNEANTKRVGGTRICRACARNAVYRRNHGFDHPTGGMVPLRGWTKRS